VANTHAPQSSPQWRCHPRPRHPRPLLRCHRGQGCLKGRQTIRKQQPSRSDRCCPRWRRIRSCGSSSGTGTAREEAASLDRRTWGVGTAGPRRQQPRTSHWPSLHPCSAYLWSRLACLCQGRVARAAGEWCSQLTRASWTLALNRARPVAGWVPAAVSASSPEVFVRCSDLRVDCCSFCRQSSLHNIARACR
jgi:hypothetical protein